MFIKVLKHGMYLDDDGSIGVYNDTFGLFTPIQLDSRHIDDNELVYEKLVFVLGKRKLIMRQNKS